jgi:hypothetical protein
MRITVLPNRRSADNTTIWEEIAAIAKRIFVTKEEEPALVPVKVNDNYNLKRRIY